MECCDEGHQTHNQQLLISLRESIVDKPPYISGTLQLPNSFFSLFYMATRDGYAARRINFANAAPDELKQLAQACEVFDEAYCKTGKMDPECFSSSLDPHRTDLIKIIRGYLLEGEESTKNMEIETYKLNIYSKGSSFNLHVDPPRNKNMFGSLVIVFPTHHEGGALFLRHRGREWIFDPSQAPAGGALDRPSIGYVAFLNDIEQDVAPVTSGHCVTLTYNLYCDDGGQHVSGEGVVSDLLIPPKLPNQDGFRESFNALLENPEFMAEGGTLAFGLRHGYQINKYLKPIYNVLKGSNTVVYQSVRALGFEPTLYMYYGDSYFSVHEGMIVDEVASFGYVFDSDERSVREIVEAEDGIPVRQDGGRLYIDRYSYRRLEIERGEPMEWVTPKTTYSRKDGVLGDVDKMRIYSIHGDACMIVRIGKAGDRLAYPTAAQIKEAYNHSGYRREWD